MHFFYFLHTSPASCSPEEREASVCDHAPHAGGRVGVLGSGVLEGVVRHAAALAGEDWSGSLPCAAQRAVWPRLVLRFTQSHRSSHGGSWLSLSLGTECPPQWPSRQVQSVHLSLCPRVAVFISHRPDRGRKPNARPSIILPNHTAPFGFLCFDFPPWLSDPIF